jgi:hypothetical protein
MLRSRKLLLVVGAACTAAIIVATAAASAATDTPVTPDSVNHLLHVVDCARVLISDPAAHAKYCDPGHDVFVSGSTGFGEASFRED